MENQVKPEPSKLEAHGFKGHFLYTRYGVILGVDEDGQEVRQAHRPKFIRVQVKVEGGRFVVSPIRQKDTDNRNVIALSLSSLQQITLTPALWKSQAFFPVLTCFYSLLVLVMVSAGESWTARFESFIDDFWYFDPDLIRMGFAVLGLLLCCMPWFWKVWHKLWRTVIYSKIAVRTRKCTYILYISSWKEAEVADFLLQAGLPVTEEVMAEE
ncbi:MAG: hypothetical protein ABI977_34845 [Acidobacteriota bacterium]